MEITFNEELTSFTYSDSTYTSTAPDFGDELEDIPTGYAGTYTDTNGYTYTLTTATFTATYDYGYEYVEEYTVSKIYASRIYLDYNSSSYKIILNEDGTITFNNTTLTKTTTTE